MGEGGSWLSPTKPKTARDPVFCGKISEEDSDEGKTDRKLQVRTAREDGGQNFRLEHNFKKKVPKRTETMEVKIDNDLERNIDIDVNPLSMDGGPYDPNLKSSGSFDEGRFDETPEKLTAKGYNVKKVKKLDLGNSGDPNDWRRASLSRNLKSISFKHSNTDGPNP